MMRSFRILGSSINSNKNVIHRQTFRLLASEAEKIAANATENNPKPIAKSFSKVLKGYGSELTKAQLSLTVSVTAAASYIAAGSAAFDLNAMTAVLFGTFLCSGSAATLNQIYEKDSDAKMNRTKNRPLPSGLIQKPAAYAFSAGLGIAGLSTLACFTNPLTAGLGAANIILYGGIYTWSKFKTEWNTEIGAVVGAVPIFMGWAAATGDICALEPWLLGSYMFMWQFPHFYSLAFMHKDDYSRGGCLMVPCNDPDGMRTAKVVMGYSVALAAFPFVTSALGVTSYMYTVEGSVIGLYQLYLSRKFYQDRTRANASNNFLFSLASIVVMIGAFVFHSRMWDDEHVKKMQKNMLTEGVASTRTVLRDHCPHEKITDAEDLCPKIFKDKALEKVEKHPKEIAAAVMNSTIAATDNSASEIVSTATAAKK